MALSKKVPMKDLCDTIGVSRQTLYRAMDKVEKAGMEALEKKTPGRKASTVTEQKARELEAENSLLRAELKQLQTKYEVAHAFLELQRMYDRGELEETGPTRARGKKKKRRSRQKPRKG